MLLSLVAAAACASAPKSAPLALGGVTQDTVLVTYLSGGVPTPAWRNPSGDRPFGRLIVGDTALALETDRGTRLFVVPMATVTDAQASLDNRARGMIAPARTDELLTVTTQTAAAADVLVFRVRRDNTSQAAAAKIRFRVEKHR